MGTGKSDGCGSPRWRIPTVLGKPIYLDNAAEFKSEALRRGCEQHGIRLDYRPPGQPHYGGIVERIIGTAMQMIHDDLPGTTFSDPSQRGEYDAEKMASLTLREVERWPWAPITARCTTACSSPRPRAGPRPWRESLCRLWSHGPPRF